MALSGKLDADFAAFFEACQRATTELKGFDSETKNVEKSLQRMVDEFSGTQLQTEAALMVEAVARVGGVSKLTEADLAKVAKTTADATKQMQAMGTTVPPEMVALSKSIEETQHATEGAKGATSGWRDVVSSMTGVLGAFGISLGVESLIGFAKGAISSAAALGDLSVMTGVATDDLQRLGFVGTEFGVSTEEIGKAVSELNKKIAQGDTTFRALGLSVEVLKQAGPTEAFLQFADAASRIEDPMQKNVIASDLLGDKLARHLIPGLADLRTKMNDVPKGALIDAETIKSANEFEATMGRLWKTTEALALKGIIFARDEVKALGKAFEESSGPMDTVNFSKYLTGVTQVAEKNTKAAESFTEFVGPIQKTLTATDILNNRLTALRDEALAPLSKMQQAQIGELEMYGVSQSEIAKLVGVSENAVKLFTEAEKASAEAMKVAAAEAQKFADVINGVVLKATGDTIALEKKRAEEREADSAKMVAAILAESEAETTLNARYGLNAMGVQKITDATETYRVAMEKLHKEESEGKPIKERAILAQAEYTDGTLKEAKAQDEATAAFWKGRDAIKEQGNETEKATAKTGVYMNQLKMLVSDPMLAGFFDSSGIGATLYGGGTSGLTPEEAAAMAAGQFIQRSGVGNVARLPGRAGGGPVSADMPYLVGERGPELFVPGRSGTIATGGGGTLAAVTNHIYVNGTAEEVARKVSAEILRTVMAGTKVR